MENDRQQLKPFWNFALKFIQDISLHLHELIIAKLITYGFTLPTLKLINNYLKHWKQRTKINNSSSLWKGIIFEAPQEPILGSIFFNIFISDLFLIINHIGLASYADDDTIYCGNNCVDYVVVSLTESVKNSLNIQMDLQQPNGEELQ